MFHRYDLLLDPHCQTVAEKPAKDYLNFTERHLQAMWLEQKYFKNILTIDEQPVQVISPGIWNAEAGPDFLKAHIKIGDKEFLGDIEMHLRSESWAQHGHHLDPRYNNVILHVAFWKSNAPIEIITPTKKVIPQLYLEDFLTISSNRIIQLIDLDLYPYKKFIGSGRCAQSLFKTMPENETVNFFRNAASWRLLQKRRYLQAHVDNPQHLMAAGYAMALGYKNNSEAFLELFLRLQKLKPASEEELLAIGMLCCGFFEESYRKKWGESEKYNRLHSIVKDRNHPPVKLVLNQIRPLNHPIRRLVALVKLISDPLHTKLFFLMSASWEQFWPTKQKPRILWEQLRDHLPTYADEYWNSHYTFENMPRKEFLSLIGDNTKNEILINAFLPLLQESILERGHAKEMEAFENFYSTLPASDTGKTRYLIHRFFGDTPKGGVLNKADVEQGAYQLHKDFCLHYEASCVGCPFVERYLQLKN